MTQQKLKILIADDLRLDLEIEKTFFERRGFEVFTASDGNAALSLAVSQLPALVILDQNMPGLNGTDVCAQLNQKAQKIPVIIVGAQETEELEQASRNAGAKAFVAKSAGREHLLQIVGRILHIPIRKRLRVTVLFSVETDGEKRQTLGQGVDVSEGGMCLEVNQQYELGSTLNLRFLLPGMKEYTEVAAKVSWVKEAQKGAYLTGLEFTDLSAMDRRRLSQFMEQALSGVPSS